MIQGILRLILLGIILYTIVSIYFDEELDENDSNSSDDDHQSYEEKYQHRDDNFNGIDSEELYFGKILGLKGKVSINQIHKKYRKKIKEYHPDQVSMMARELREIAEKRTKELNEAYEYFKKKYS